MSGQVLRNETIFDHCLSDKVRVDILPLCHKCQHALASEETFPILLYPFGKKYIFVVDTKRFEHLLTETQKGQFSPDKQGWELPLIFGS